MELFTSNKEFIRTDFKYSDLTVKLEDKSIAKIELRILTFDDDEDLSLTAYKDCVIYQDR